MKGLGKYDKKNLLLDTSVPTDNNIIIKQYIKNKYKDLEKEIEKCGTTEPVRVAAQGIF